MGRKSNLLLLGAGGKDVAAGWTPSDLTNSIWFDFTDSATMTLDTTSVSDITAKGSFSSLPTLSNTGTSRPTYNTTHTTFDGSNDHLYNATRAFFGAGNDLPGAYATFGVWVVGQINPSGAQKMLVSETSTSSGFPFCHFMSATADNTELCVHIRNLAGTLAANEEGTSAGALDNTMNYMGIEVDTTGSDLMEGFLGGSSTGTEGFVAALGGTYGMDTAVIGASRGSGTPANYMAMNLRHVILMPSRVTGDDLTSLHAWMAAEAA